MAVDRLARYLVDVVAQGNGEWRGLFMRHGGLHEGRVTWHQGRLHTVVIQRSLATDETMAGARILAPAWVDLQINGAFGVSVEEGQVALETLARRLPAHGVLRFCPTLVSSSADTYPRLCHIHQAFVAANLTRREARSLGLHLEGPLLAPARAGAHSRRAICDADVAVLDDAVQSGQVAIVTCAPEREGILAKIAAWTERKVLVALGHSEATFEEAKLGIDAGARLITHVFNAMPSLHHRHPGLVGAALTDSRAFVSLIADGSHLHPAVAELAIRARTCARTVLVSDAVAAAAMPSGAYVLGTIAVHYDGVKVHTADGTLAGSGQVLDHMVLRAATWPGVGLAGALQMASEVPAQVIGAQDWGCLATGYVADMVEVAHDGRVLQVYCAGVPIA